MQHILYMYHESLAILSLNSFFTQNTAEVTFVTQFILFILCTTEIHFKQKDNVSNFHKSCLQMERIFGRMHHYAMKKVYRLFLHSHINY